jgi:elongation factor G
VLCAGFPSPADHVLPPIFSPQGAALAPLRHRDDEPLVATVLRTVGDPYVGRLSLVRVYSGTLQAEQVVHVAGRFRRTAEPGPADWHADHDDEDRAGALHRTLGDQRQLVEVARAGDVVVVARLQHAETGDTLSDPARPAVLVPWELPGPTYPAALRVAPKDEVKLVQGLQRLLAEDPSARTQVSDETGQLLLWTQGEQHLQVLLDRLGRRAGIEVLQDPVRVPLRETLAGPSEVQGRHVKQSGGHGQYAVVDMRFAAEPDRDLEFVDEVVGGTVPRQFIGSVEQGVRAQMRKGIRGWPLTGVRAVLHHGKAHSVDSSDAAFQTAGSLAVQEAARASGTTVLEPVDRVVIHCDEETVGAVLGGLGQRRARVEGTEALGDGRAVVVAEVPAFELLRYGPVLRSQSRGTGTLRREHLRYEPAPAHLVQTLAAGA